MLQIVVDRMYRRNGPLWECLVVALVDESEVAPIRLMRAAELGLGIPLGREKAQSVKVQTNQGLRGGLRFDLRAEVGMPPSYREVEAFPTVIED